MSNYYHHDNYYSSGPPPPPHHDAYPMYDMPQYAPTPATDDGYVVGGKQNGGYQYLQEDPAQPIRQRRSCCDRLCCGCCTCLPRWARWLCCLLFLIIIAIAIVIGVLAALFKVPQVNFNGLSGEPQFNLTGTTANFYFNLNITVDNHNVEGITFEKIAAQAYYPGYHNMSIGSGSKDNVHISSNAVTTIIFPFTISLDAANSESQAILDDILNKCGFLGGNSQGITIDYDVTPTLRIIGIAISPTTSEQATIPCDSSSMPDLTGLQSLIPSGAIPIST